MSVGPALRVCFAIQTYPPEFGGHGIQIQRTLPYLIAQGIAPSVLTYRLPGSPATTAVERTGPLHRVLSDGDEPVSKIARVLQFRRHVRTFRPAYDVLHSVLHGWELLLNIPYLRARGLPLIVESVLLDSDDPLTLAHERFGRLKIGLLRRVDAWVGISGAFLPRLTAVGIPEDRFHLIYGGVDVHRYSPMTAERRLAVRRKLGLPAGARIVLSVGSVIPRKGMDRVLKGWAELHPVRGRDLLLIVGPTSAADGLTPSSLAHLGELQRLADAPGLAGTIRFTGRVENLEEFMGAADLFLFLSRREGLGYVTLEAMACGLPCAISPLDGIASELVAAGRTGVIIEDPDNPRLVASSVSRLLSSPSERQAMGQAARRVAVSRFSLERRAAALADLYRGIMARRRKIPSPAQESSVGPP